MVREVMRGLRGRADAGKLPAFRFVEINALRLPTPQHAYVQLHRVRGGLIWLPAPPSLAYTFCCAYFFASSDMHAKCTGCEEGMA
jgi:hypothetical protein